MMARLRTLWLFSFFMLPMLTAGSVLMGAERTLSGGADFSAVAKQALPAVVSIEIKPDPQARSQRHDDFFEESFFHQFFHLYNEDSRAASSSRIRQLSGFLISADGHLVTNGYIPERSHILVSLQDGRQLPATQRGYDPNTDIALLKIDATKLPFLEFADSKEIQLGTWVAALGNATGHDPFLTVGVVSALSKGSTELKNTEDFIQTDAGITHSNVGGPLLNLSGHVIGMNTLIIPAQERAIGLVIPSPMLRFVADQLLKNGKVIRSDASQNVGPFALYEDSLHPNILGIEVEKLTPDLAQKYNLIGYQGIIIRSVNPKSKAAWLDLKPGALLIEINKQPINSEDDFYKVVSSLRPGDNVLMLVREDSLTHYVTFRVQ